MFRGMLLALLYKNPCQIGILKGMDMLIITIPNKPQLFYVLLGHIYCYCLSYTKGLI